jgi:hypothetical protein
MGACLKRRPHGFCRLSSYNQHHADHINSRGLAIDRPSSSIINPQRLWQPTVPISATLGRKHLTGISLRPFTTTTGVVSRSAALSVVVVAGIQPTIAIPDWVAVVIVRVTEATNEDPAVGKSVNCHVPVDVGAMPGTGHRSKADGTVDGAKRPHSAEAPAMAAAKATPTVAATPSSNYSSRS